MLNCIPRDLNSQHLEHDSHPFSTIKKGQFPDLFVIYIRLLNTVGRK